MKTETMILLTAVGGCFVAWCACAIAADADRRGVEFAKQTSLSDAVEQFNAKVNQSSDIGRAQPPLTVDEVVAAIRAWDTEKNPVEPELYAVFNSIAETGKLPPGSELVYTTGWDPGRGYDFTVWWVNLSLSSPNPAAKDSRLGYTYRIRERTLSSRPSGDPVANPLQDKIVDAERQRNIAKHILEKSNEAGN